MIFSKLSQYQILCIVKTARISCRFTKRHSPLELGQSTRTLSSHTPSHTDSPMAKAQSPPRDKCIFCKIADGKEKNEIFFEDEEVVVFEDIRPAAKFHLLVIPKEHIKDSKALVPAQLKLLDRLIEVGNSVLGEKLASDPSSDSKNVQKLMGFHWPPFHTVSHLHLHVIAPTDQMSFLARTIFRPNSLWFVSPEYVRDRLITMGENSSSSGTK